MKLFRKSESKRLKFCEFGILIIKGRYHRYKIKLTYSDDNIEGIRSNTLGFQPNIEPGGTPLNLDSEREISSFFEKIAIHQATDHISHFDGDNITLAEFWQEIVNRAVFIPLDNQAGFISVARESVRGK